VVSYFGFYLAIFIKTGNEKKSSLGNGALFFLGGNKKATQ
jgi:hypothetical protein